MSLDMLIAEGIFFPTRNTQFVIHFSVKGITITLVYTIVLDMDNNKIALYTIFCVTVRTIYI